MIERTAGRPSPTLAERLETAIDRMLAALAEEATALSAGSPETLLQAIAGKRRSLQELESLARDPRVRSLLDARDAPQAAVRLRDKLKDCRMLNLAVGSSIITSRRDNEQLLRLLGHSPEAPEYGSSGQATNGVRPRILARA